MTVQHDPERGQFYVPLADGAEASLFYTMFSDDIIDLRHTEVPRSARGQGLADALARAALAYAREQHFNVIITCPFVKRWLQKHPEERPAGAVDRSTD
jgi:predicted GNAT family acetyltransferase